MHLNYLHVIVPQGEAANPKKENLFNELLENLHNMVHHGHFSLEFFGFEQYTYCYVVVPDSLLETMEGLLYSIYPDCEIKPQKDYTLLYNYEKQAIAGTSLKFKFFD